MCRVAYIQPSTTGVDGKFLEELFTDLEKEAGGDGNGIGGFVEGHPLINKSTEMKTVEVAHQALQYKWDSGFLFHTRRASVGEVNSQNCHPFMWGNTVTIHNGHVEGFGVMKLMMLQNLEKYSPDGWTLEKIISTTDSDILAYFIWKLGFDIVQMMASGTVITMYPDHVKIFVGYGLQAIEKNGTRIYASSFTDAMGMLSDQWVIFTKGTELTINSTGECAMKNGTCFDGKAAWALMQSKKGKKKKHIEV